MNTPVRQEIFELQSHGHVMQDKNAHARIFAASDQPIDTPTPAHMAASPVHMADPSISSKRHGSNKRQTYEVAGYVSFPVKERLERMREQWGKTSTEGKKLSMSQVVATLLTKGVQRDADMQYGSMLEPVITTTIKGQMQGDTNRLASLAAKAYYEAAQARLITTEILRHLYGDATKEFAEKIASIEQEAHNSLSPKKREKH